MNKPLELDIADKVATIRLNRPERKNSFTFAMIDDWVAALAACREDPDVNVIMVTGTGDSFCSGIDFEELKERIDNAPEERKNELWNGVQRIPLLLEGIDKPVIAAVNGVAVGAGMDLALMADIRFAAQRARFSETYIKVGLVPGAGGAVFLPRLVGPAKALELFWSADFIDAAEALRLGMVNRVLPDDELAAHAQAFCRKLAEAPQHSVRMIKRLVQQGMRNDLRTSLDLVSSHYTVATSTAAHRTAVKDFLSRSRG